MSSKAWLRNRDPAVHGNMSSVYGADYGYYDNGYCDEGTAVAVVLGADANWCAQTYRSYDPASWTYLGYDGRRHPCP